MSPGGRRPGGGLVKIGSRSFINARSRPRPGRGPAAPSDPEDRPRARPATSAGELEQLAEVDQLEQLAEQLAEHQAEQLHQLAPRPTH